MEQTHSLLGKETKQMNRTYEDMSKEELVTLVKRMTKQHDEWSAEAKRLREGIKEQVRMLIEGCSCVTKTECTEKLGELIG